MIKIKRIMAKAIVIFLASISTYASDAEAQYDLGVDYFYGIGVEKNYPKAYSFFKKSAEQGYVHAQYNLSAMYRLGLGTLKDEVQAFEWNMKAAMQGDEDANYNVCIMYRDGIGVERSPEKSMEWYIANIKDEGHGNRNTVVGMIYSGEFCPIRYKVAQ